MRLENKVALVTGASRNIGRAVAISFAREGADLVISAKERMAELHEVADRCATLGRRAVAVQSDVADPSSSNQLVSRAIESFGRVDVLVSAVAIRPHTPFLDLSAQEWHDVMAVNLDATFHLAKAVLPGMVERGSGSIIAFGGLVSLTGVANSAATSASKTGLLGLIRALAAEFGPAGVRANLITPGNIDTERANPEWYASIGDPTPSTKDAGHIPLRRYGEVDEVAAACVFLASDDSSYVTGNQVVCNGGAFMS